MEQIPVSEYEITAELYSSGSFRIVKATGKADGRNYCLKTTHSEYPDLAEIELLKNEFRIGQRHSGSLLRIHQKFEDGRRMFLVTDEADGIPLADYRKGRSLKDLLEVAWSISTIFTDLEANRIVLRDVRPDHFLVDPQQRRTVLVDWGQAFFLDEKEHSEISEAVRADSLPYISPELTGRTTWVVDHRSDLYSLGVCLYWLFTGELPFSSTDPLELVYFHVARKPIPPHKHQAEIPLPLSDLIMKLLEKSPSERYASANGLHHDLKFILQNLEDEEALTAFTVGRNELSGQLRPPETVIGRDGELELLRDQYRRAQFGEARFVLLTGPQGIGKSFLSAAFRGELTHKEALLISGNFLKLNRDFSSSALVDGLRGQLRRFLSLDNQTLRYWKDRIQKEASSSLSALLSLIPELEHLLIKVEEVPELEPNEEQNRIYFAFRSLIRVLADVQHPVVVCLDDLQWADFTTLKLIQELAADPELRHFYLIGVLRDKDIVNPAFVTEIIESISAAENCLRLELQELGVSDIGKWLSETLGPAEDHSDLASLVSRRTKGIPFFVNQFLWFTQAKGLLNFIPEEGLWKYDLRGAQNLQVSETIAEIVKSRAVLLPPKLKQVLSVASLLGYRFSSKLLVSLLHMDPGEAALALQQAGDSGIIMPESRSGQGDRLPKDSFDFPEDHRFIHNSLQSFFYHELPSRERDNLHYQVGEFLHHQNPTAKEEEAYPILNHLNLGWELVDQQEEQIRLARQNLACGLKARQSNAYEQAIFYFHSGINFLKAAGIEEDIHDAGFELLFNLGECQYLIGEYKESEKSLRELLDRWKSNTHQLKGVKAICRLFITLGRHEECLAAGYKVLENLQVVRKLPVSKTAINLALVRGVMKLRFSLSAKKLSTLHTLQHSEDPELLAVLSLYRELLVSSLSVNPSLFGLIVVRQVQLVLKKGLTPYAPAAFMSYAIMNAVALKNFKAARSLGQLAISLSTEMKLEASVWESRFAWQHFLLHLKESVRDHLEGYTEISRKLTESGVPVYSGYMVNSRVWAKACLGVPLDEVRQEAAGYIRNFRIRGEEELLDMMMPRLIFCEVLQGKLNKPWVMHTSNYDFNEKFEALRSRGSYSVLGGMVLAKIQLCWLFRRFREGMEMIERGEAFIRNMEGIYFTSDYYLYATLIISGYYEEEGQKAPRSVLKKVRRWQGQLKKLKEAAPENYASHFALLKAEIEHLRGFSRKARQAYLEAAELAQQYKYSVNYAVANEQLFRILERSGKGDEGVENLLNARQGYRIWGAMAKVEHLENLYGIYFPGSETAGEQANTKTEGLAYKQSGQNLDLNSILKAANALAGETRINALLETLVRILLENATSQRGCFILNDGGFLRIKVIGELKESHFQASHPDSVLSPELVPVSVLNYVTRTREAVILNEGIREKYPSDSYLQTNEPRSILCQPVLKQGKLLGIIYLENRLVPNSFTPVRVELLSLLSGQIGISIENAILIENLEQKVQERTQELEKEKKKSDDLLLNILPERTANELKETGKTQAKKYDSVCILFSDIVAFTQHAEEATPGQLVEYLDTYFQECDEIVGKYGLEKIKTIGDAYLCVGGLPEEDADCHVNMIHAAQDMLKALKRLKDKGRVPFEIRIGIHSGSVVAGVVGSKKFAFDIWGDDVNIAARMEAASTPGRINISETTYQIVKNQFTCEFRGEIKAKNKGELPMYFVETDI